MPMTKDLPVVVLIGRTNVGKSSLFNALVEERRALVARSPGTTRDRRNAVVSWRGARFFLTDTGGMDGTPDDALAASIAAQTQAALRRAVVAVLVCDGARGVTEADRTLARRIRAIGKPAVVAVNKVHRPGAFDPAPFLRLGIPKVLPLSALTGVGTGDLLDAVAELVPHSAAVPEIRPTRISIIGRPNVGKSSLLNALIGEDRTIVHHMPGTTREAIEVMFSYRGQPFTIVDTAGMRRRTDRAPFLERKAIEESMRALRTADLCLLVIDPTEPLTRQERALAGRIENARAAVVIVANKWDLIRQGAAEALRGIQAQFAFLPWAPIIPFSAKERRPLSALLEAIATVQASFCRRIAETDCADVLARTIRRLPGRKGNVGWQLVSLMQDGVAPPRFRATIRGKVLTPPALPHIIERVLRERYDWRGTPLRITIFRERP